MAHLSGCGFRLRGSVDVPETLTRVHIDGLGEYAPLAQELRRVLQRSGTLVVKRDSKPESIIQVSNEQFKRRVLSVDSRGRAAEYELDYRFQFMIVKPDGESLVPLQKIQLLRDYRFDPNNVLAADAEEAQIRKEMISFGVRQMMRRIDSYMKTHEKPAE